MSPTLNTTGPILGAHQSIAGGFEKAVERAYQTGCQCLQLFTKNNTQWAAKAISAEEVRRFQAALQFHGIDHLLAHSSYLINLASPAPRLWRKSVAAFIGEMQRAELLGIPYVVTHPGSFTTAEEMQGLKNIIRAIDEIQQACKGLEVRCLLETTAGQGTALGWRFEQFAAILEGVKEPERLGFCFDTCHVFAAGYPLAPEKHYHKTMSQFDHFVGLHRIKAFHLNDSRHALGSRIDRHEHIGRGKLGLEPFRLLLKDKRFRNVPMYLETPKGVIAGEDWDVVNLRTLRQLKKE